MSSFVINEAAVLNKLVLVDVTVKIWSARKKLHTQDLGSNVVLPSSELVSLGTKYMIDLAHLNVFDKLKRRALRVVESRGIRLVGAYGIPEESILEAVAELDVVEADFNKEKANFLANYDKYCQEWINQPAVDPSWREALRRSVTPKGYVERALNFDVTLCRLVADETSPETSKGLVRKVQGLSNQLFQDVAQEAEDIMGTLSGRDQVNQRTVNRLWAMHAKLTSLAFVSPEVHGLADYLQDQLKTLPAKGWVEGSAYRHLVSLVINLSDEDRIGSLVKAMSSTEQSGDGEVVDEFAGMFSSNAPASEPVTVPALVAVQEPVEEFEEVAAEVAVTEPTQSAMTVDQEVELALASVDLGEAAAAETTQFVPAVLEDKQEQAPVSLIPETPEQGGLDFCM